MPKHKLTPVFHALGNPTRLAVFERLCLGPASVSELADPFSMALPSFMQHLDVLEAAELVESHKRGRVRTYRARPVPMLAMSTWLESRRTEWEARLDQLDDYLESTWGT